MTIPRVYSDKMLYSHTQLPYDFREVAIVNHYRHPTATIVECLKSLFKLHNETFNVWTHLISFFLYTFYVCQQSQEMDLFSEENLPYFGLLLTSCLYPLGSACAHLFNNMSTVARHVCFMIDYSAIALYAYGATIANHIYAMPHSWRGGLFYNYFLPGMFLMCCLTIVISSHTRFMPINSRTKVVRLSSFALPYIFGKLPIMCRYLFCASAQDCDQIENYGWHFLWIGIAVAFYASHLPERIWPGKFDVFCHSHQWFHVAVCLATYYHAKGIEVDMQNHRLRDQSFFARHTLFLIIALAVCCSAIVVYFGRKMHRLKTSLQKSEMNGYHNNNTYKSNGKLF